MNNKKLAAVLALTIGFLAISVPMLAHHGSGISYDMTKPVVKKAIITEFQYINPHPIMFFDIKDENGTVEHWESEIITNPSAMIRNGWGKSKTLDALKVGTPVTLTLGISKAGGHSAVVMKIVNEKGEEIVTRAGNNGAGNGP